MVGQIGRRVQQYLQKLTFENSCFCAGACFALVVELQAKLLVACPREPCSPLDLGGRAGVLVHFASEADKRLCL